MGFYAGRARPVRESDSGLAILMNIDDRGFVWVPKSAINNSESEIIDVSCPRGKLVVKHWFSKDRGWEYEPKGVGLRDWFRFDMAELGVNETIDVRATPDGGLLIQGSCTVLVEAKERNRVKIHLVPLDAPEV